MVAADYISGRTLFLKINVATLKMWVQNVPIEMLEKEEKSVK